MDHYHFDNTATSAPAQALSLCPPQTPDDWLDGPTERDRRAQRATKKRYFDKLRYPAYDVGRNTDDPRYLKRTILNYAEALREEDPSHGKHLTREYCYETAIQIIDWVWPRSRTWRYPERRHHFTREQCRLGGQRSRSPKRVPDEKRAEIRRLRAEGVKRSEVSQRFGITEKTVSRICNAQQGPVTRLEGKGPSLSTKQKDKNPGPPKRVSVPSRLDRPNRGPRLPQRAKTGKEDTPRPRARTDGVHNLGRSGMRHILQRLYRRLPFTPEDAEEADKWAQTAPEEEIWTAIGLAQRGERFDACTV